MPINTTQPGVVFLSDNPNRWEEGTYTSNGSHVVRYDPYLRQHTWIKRLQEASELEVDPPINGKTNVQEVLESLRGSGGGGGVVAIDFTQSDLSIAGILPITLDVIGVYYDVTVYSDTGEEIEPDNVIITPTNFIVVLSTYQPLNGVWHLQYRY